MFLFSVDMNVYVDKTQNSTKTKQNKTKFAISKYSKDAG